MAPQQGTKEHAAGREETVEIKRNISYNTAAAAADAAAGSSVARRAARAQGAEPLGNQEVAAFLFVPSYLSSVVWNQIRVALLSVG